jgi:hypothetical protein
MDKGKVIHTRVSDAIYEKIVKRAKENGITVSGYSRVIFKEHDYIITSHSDPFESDEFNHLIQWMYNVRFYPLQAHIYDVKHYLDIIKKYYSSLDFTFQRLFNNVIDNLDQLIILSNKEKEENPEGQFADIYLFGRENNELSFDYDKFEKHLEEKFM